MPLLKFNYSPNLTVDPKTKKYDIIYRPYIPIRLCYVHNLGKTQVYCLLDCGSDRNLFPASWGESVGINIKKGEEINILGIGNTRITAYKHQVKLFIGTASFATPADFSYFQNTPLLGRENFFNLFKQVSLKQKEKIIELEY